MKRKLRKEAEAVVVVVVEGGSVWSGYGGGGVCVCYGTCGFGTNRKR